MVRPKALILTGFGINSEAETAWAFSRAGAECDLIHFNTLSKNPSLFEQYQIFVLSGGWSFADNIQSGRVLANKLRFNLQKEFTKFVDDDKVVLGICNGFQVLTQLGVIPGSELSRKVTLMHNKSGQFENRWVNLRTENCVCPFARSMSPIFSLPIRHGEGQVVIEDKKTFESLIDNRQVVFRYAGPDGLKAEHYPDNPNGSADAIAGLCNKQGNVIGLMPHPECHISYLQNPLWTQNPPHSLPANPIQTLLKKLGVGKKPYEDSQNCSPFFSSIVEFAKKRI